MPFLLRITLILTILLGAGLRLTGMDHKIYSHDETLTSLRSAGVLFSEYEHAVMGRIISVAALKNYQKANDTHDFRSTIRALAIDDPQHPPLYYLIDRSWSSIFGNSIASRRSIGALFGVLTIPALFWLCLELSPRSRTWAIVSAALFSISPFQIQYAQQAREYTLWGLITVVSSALLIRAARKSSWWLWLAFAASGAIGLYTDLFFAFVLVAQAVFIFYAHAESAARSRRAYVVSVVACLISYVPWLINLYQQRETVASTNGWFALPLPAVVYVYKLLFGIGSVFFDAEYANIWLSVVLAPIVAIVVWSLYVTSRAPVRAIPIFVWSVIGLSIAPLVIPDLILHQSRATAPRYMVPAWIGLDLSVSYAIMSLLSSGKIYVQKIAVVLTIIIVSMGFISSAANAKATAWWPASSEQPLLGMAQVINAQPSSTIVTGDAAMALNLSNYLRAETRFDFKSLPPLSAGLSNLPRSLLIISPSVDQRTEIAQYPGFKLTSIYAPHTQDSPMLHGASFLSKWRTKLAAIHAKAGFSGVRFDLWKIEQLTNFEMNMRKRVTANAPGHLIDTAYLVGLSESHGAIDISNVPHPPDLVFSKLQGNGNPFFTPAIGLIKTQLSAAVVDSFWNVGLASSDSPLNANGPVYVVSSAINSDAPELRFQTYLAGATNSFSGHRVHVPRWATNQCGTSSALSSGGDCHLIVVDLINGYEVDGWQCANGGAGGTYNGRLHATQMACTWGGSYRIGGNGLGKLGEGGVHAGFAIGMVDIRPLELLDAEKGRPISHALMMGTKCLNNPSVYPADNTNGSDSLCDKSSPGDFPSYGDLIVLSPTPSIPVASHSAPCRAILAAMQKYGAYLGDTGGSNQLLTLSDFVYVSDPSKPTDPWVAVLNEMIAGGDASGSYNAGGSTSAWSSCLQDLQASDFKIYQVKKP